MKFIILLLFSIVLSPPAQSQVWIDSGAVWHYKYGEIMGMKSFNILEYSSDTVIQGHLCQEITSESHSFIEDNPDVWYAFPVSKRIIAHTYVDGDTVFYLASDGEFRVLLNFGAQIGDTWDISYFNDNDSTTQDTSRVIVVDNGTTGGNRYIELAMETCSHENFAGKFDERYGFIPEFNYDNPAIWAFPESNFSCLSNSTYCGGPIYFCSYSDARGQLHGISGENCEFPGIKILGTSEAETFNFQIFPNPIKDNFRITGLLDKGIDAVLVDVSGKKVMELTNVLNNQLIDVSELKSGIYILQLSVDGTVETKKIVIQ